MVAKVVTKPEFSVAKEKMLVALVTVSVAISSPANDTSLIFKNTEMYLKSSGKILEREIMEKEILIQKSEHSSSKLERKLGSHQHLKQTDSK